jgi:carboxyl-terminal processing protease
MIFNINKKNFGKKLTAIIVVLLINNFLYSQNADSIRKKIQLNSEKFKYMLETIFDNYVDSVDLDKISEQSFKTLLNSLDKNSYYFNKEQLYNRQITAQGYEVGVGIDIRVIDQNVFVYSVVEKSPADLKGIKPYDKILEIDSTNLQGKDFGYILTLLKGEKNSSVKLKIEKAFSGELQEINLIRDDVPVSSINVSLILPNTKIIYISSRNFSKISHSEFRKIIEKYKKQKIKGIIFDLRDNPGGYLDQVSAIIDDLLDSGKTIWYTNARNDAYKQKLLTSGGGICETTPLIIIMNKKSASACELFAGVVQDYDRGFVIGQRSFGKGSIQLLWNMIDSTGFQVSVAEYFTPLGRKIDIKNIDSITIDPTAKLNLDDTTFSKINEIVNQVGIGSKLPVYHSSHGRTLLGGGGIFPDFTMEEEHYTLLTSILLQRNIIFEYVYEYLSANKNLIEKQYQLNADKFINDFDVTDKMLFNLKNISYKKNIWNEEMFLTDKEKIKYFVKAEIARIIFGSNAYYSILITNDKWIQKAIEIFPESTIIYK